MSVKTIIKSNIQLITFIFSAFLIMLFVSYFYVNIIVRDQMLIIGEETMNTMEASVSSSLSESGTIFSGITRTVESLLASGVDKEELLAELEAINDYYSSERSPIPDFMKIYAYAYGEFLDGSGWVHPADYDATVRPWYIGADTNDNKLFFSEPYIDAETKDMCMSFSQKLVNENGDDFGILAIDLNLSGIISYVDSRNIAGNGYGVLLSDSLHFTTHKDANLVGSLMIDASGNYDKIAIMLETGRPINAMRFKDSDGTVSIAYFRTIFNGWHLGVIVPRISYYSDVYNFVIILSIIAFVLMIALSIVLVRLRLQKIKSDEENKSKSTFLARMSHEMRTPMNAILGMAKIAENSDDEEQIKSCLAKISAAGSHLLGVINDILDMSKIEAGKLELTYVTFSIKELIDQVITVTSYGINKKSQNFTVEIDENLPEYFIGDKQRLAQVITNLLSNASKFTHEGGNIGLYVKQVKSEHGECLLQFKIKDDGIGLSEEHQSRLFESFEQIDNSASRKYGGAGLGLSISKSIIDQMGGDTLITSELGNGSTFSFTVKMAVAQQPEDEETAHELDKPDDNNFSGKHILLAEDVEINREVILALLEDTKVNIDVAVNGIEAYEKFVQAPDKYDLIFMDIQMPEMDGMEAAKRIRAVGTSKAIEIPIVAMTANVFKDDIEQYLSVGMNGHVGKPIDIDLVLEKMNMYLL